MAGISSSPGPTGLNEKSCAFSASARVMVLSGIIDVDRDGADAWAMRDVVRMGKAVRFAIDDQFDIALRPALDILAAMGTGLAKAELAEQRGQLPGFGFIDGEFDEADAAALRFRLQPRRRRADRALGQLVLQQNQRTQPVGRGADRRAGAELIVEYLQRQRAGIPGRRDSLHEGSHRQIALTREATEMPAPGQHVEAKFRRVRKLHQEDLVRRDRLHRGNRKCRRQRVEAIENDPDRFVIGAAHDLPGVAIVVDVTTPGQRLEADAQAARGGQFAESVEIRSRPINSPERGRRDIAADQQQIGPQFLHQVELVLRTCEVAPALRLGHSLEITKRLERANAKAKVAAEPPDVAGAAVERQQIVLENLDRVEAGAGDGAQLFVERATQLRRWRSSVWSCDLLQDLARRDAGIGSCRLTHGFNDSKGNPWRPRRDQRRLAAGDDGKEMPQPLHKRIE